MSIRMEQRPPRAFDPAMKDEVGSSRATPGWDLATERRIDDGVTLARALGWFSIGLGVGEVVAARELASYLGMKDRAGRIRWFGAREIAQGISILAQRKPKLGIYSRIAGDALDLATLASGLHRRNRYRDRVLVAIAAVAGVALLDLICASQLDSGTR